ncbi:MAG: hypothetical protein LQ340_007951 [Diploschistes diacapsis]|nr:MAG: hypothetical protein LQ340_007951 [Diploschistes diacapsis]
MSTVYNVEPPPTAKVLLQTTSGDIELELFAKQTPLTSRNFLQLCIDGYYNGTIFHRLVPGFVIQGGDPTGTGEGGEAIYDGGTFADEFHNRLRFNRRGLLGMANTGRKDDNGSQFFLTLGKAEELTGKNTMFGRVVGDTIYNVMRMGDAELEELEGSERPLYPAKVTRAEILVNPFEDMVQRKVTPKAMPTAQYHVKKKAKKKGGKALLSFEDDEGEDAEQLTPKKAKFNPKLVARTNGKDNTTGQGVNGSRNGEGHNHRAYELPTSMDHSKSKTPRTTRRRDSSESPKPTVRPNMSPETQLPLPDQEKASRSPPSSPESADMSKMSSLLDKTNAQIAQLKASMKRNVQMAATDTGRKKSVLEQLVPENAKRGRKRKQAGAQNEAQTLEMLDAFRARLGQTPASTDRPDQLENDNIATEGIPEKDDNGVADENEEAQLCDLHFIANCQSCQSWNKQEGEAAEDDDADDKGWMSHSLNFKKDRLGKDLNWKKRNEEELVVIDPREKAKGIKEEQRARKQGHGSSRAWDRGRERGQPTEKMAGERG